MPTGYVKKLARKHGVSTGSAESQWKKAKKAALKSGHGENFAYVTSIFKNMMHEAPEAPTLKHLTEGLTFKYFLIAEAEEAMVSTKDRSKAWKYLEKFPQFNELSFKTKRALEKDAAEIVDDYEALPQEEQESIDDHMHDAVIDAMQKEVGAGPNMAKWNEPSSQDQDDTDSAIDKWEAATGMDAETGDEIPAPAPQQRRSSGPRHLAPYKASHIEPADAGDSGVTNTDVQTAAASVPGMVSKGKSYYKNVSNLSPEQRAGRSKLWKKHGLVFRLKQASWFKQLKPETQQEIVNKIHSEEYTSADHARAHATGAHTVTAPLA